MNVSKIINFILLIFIAHLILININVSKLIKFENNSFNIQEFLPNMEEYTPPLMSEYIEDQPQDLLEPRDELYKFIHESNYYPDNNNSANFKTNVMRVDNFYKENKNEGVNYPKDKIEKEDSKYSEFNSDCQLNSQNQSSLINDIRMGFQN
jgi:hypothetical protein